MMMKTLNQMSQTATIIEQGVIDESILGLKFDRI